MIHIDLLKGVINDDLPQKEPSEIRIFLSSTFKDYQLERNYIIEHLYEPLRQLCNQQYQKDFILIDLRWGITEEALNQNLGSEICMDEIDKCRKESIGPYFVCFLSHRYGTKFLKATILEKEFEMIRKESSSRIPYKHIASLLDYCYQLDENSIKERKYKLKNVDILLKELNIESSEWDMQSDMLVDRIRKAADDLFKAEKIRKNERDQYFISVTDEEIRYGLLKENNPNRKCAAFFRNITGVDETSGDKKRLKAFFEGKDVESDLKILKQLIEKTLSKQNRREFQIEWNKSNELKEPYTNEVMEYLNDFGEGFQSIVKELIKENINEITKEYTRFESEILHHALICNKFIKQAIKRDDTIDKIESYLNNESNTKPFIVTGASGSGKSTVLAYAIKHLKTDNNVFIYRFMGTSRDSSNIKSVFISILEQIEKIYYNFDQNIMKNKEDKNEPKEKEFESTSEIRERFIKKIEAVSSKIANEKLVIVLDSIDQLSESDYNLGWFIYDLPKNIKMIYSVIPDYCDILNKLKMNLEYGKSNYLKVNELENSEAKTILENWLTSIDRKLTGSSKDKNTSTQWSFINELLSKTSQIYPLHIRIIFEIVSKWPSWHTVESDFMECVSTKDTIKYLFKQLEMFHGEMLFSRCIFYLTLFEYSGISEPELEDILSIDDALLNSVFVHHHPPVRRFQIALWLKIKYEIKDYITSKETDGVSVISWFHRSFIEASQEYYQNMFEASDLKDKLIMNVIDYFIETFNETRLDGTKGIKKEFEYKKKKISNSEKITCVTGNTYSAYRYTKSQKIKSILENGQTIYNKRKLNELINVISMMQNNATKLELLKEHVYFNYEFMYAKCELRDIDFIFEMDSTISKLQHLLTNVENAVELIEINEIYKRIYPVIRQNANLLSFEVMCRLSETKSNCAEKFKTASGLKMITKRFKNNESVRNFFIYYDNKVKISRFYDQHNGNLVFIESNKSGDTIQTIIDVIDSTTTMSLGSFTFDRLASHIQIILVNQSTNSLQAQFTDLNGFIYFSDGSSLFSLSLPYQTLSLINSFDTEIKGLLLLKSSRLLVILESSLEYNSACTEQTCFFVYSRCIYRSIDRPSGYQKTPNSKH